MRPEEGTWLWMEWCFLWCTWCGFSLTLADPILHMTQFSCPSIQCNYFWNCSSRKTSKQLHQQCVWVIKLCLKGKNQWLQKKLHIFYTHGEKSVWNFFRWAQNLEILYPENGLKWLLPVCLRIRVMDDLVERGNQLVFYNEKKLFIRCLKASSPGPSANPCTSQCCVTQAFYCYSLHVNVSLSQHKLAAVNTASTNYQEMICLRKKCCKLSSPHNVLKHP